jgi:hypothetical protein
MAFVSGGTPTDGILKSDGDGHKETYLDNGYFHVFLNIYLFVNKGKIFDAQGS